MLINPTTLKARLERAKEQVPILVVNQLKRSNLELLNQKNLEQGKDNKGGNMPPYSLKSSIGIQYANFKTSINPRNRGFWDLRLTGDFWSKIQVIINERNVRFLNTKNDLISRYIYSRKPSRDIWGIEKEQMYEVQLKNKEIIRKELDKIINNGL